MKMHKPLGTLAKSAASVLVLGGFIWLFAASLEDFFALPVTKVLDDGRIQETTSFSTDGASGTTTFTTVITGNKTPDGIWKDSVEIIKKRCSSSQYCTTSVSTGIYVDGEKHGTWTVVTTSPRGKETEFILFDLGVEVTRWKGGNAGSSGVTAYQVLNGEHYFFLNSLEIYGLTGDKIRVYTDSIEAHLNGKDFGESVFESEYVSVRDELDSYPEFDSISGTVAYLAHYDGMYRIKKHDLRMAVLDRNRAGTGTTYDMVCSGYPGYLQYMNYNLVTNAEFGLFCHELDSTMDTYGPLDPRDVFFADSVDRRLYRAISAMGSASTTFGPVMAKMAQPGGTTFKAAGDEAGKILKAVRGLKTSSDRALNVYANDLYGMYLEADVVMVSVRRAYFARKQWVQLPLVTTGYAAAGSMTSVVIRGSVFDNGGAAVTSRGVAWADTYNPSLVNHFVRSGEGQGIFEVVIDGLEPGKVYYARSFATNSAGTGYGNCIEFTTGRISSIHTAAIDPLTAVIYPNPANDKAILMLTVNRPSRCRLTLMTIDGRAVYQQEIRHPGGGALPVGLDLSFIQPGVYWCRVTDGTCNAAIRLLKAE